jgi:hypothetical protein
MTDPASPFHRCRPDGQWCYCLARSRSVVQLPWRILRPAFLLASGSGMSSRCAEPSPLIASGSGRNSFCAEQVTLSFVCTFPHSCCRDMRLLTLELCLEVAAEHFFLSGPRVNQSDSSRGGSSRRGTACKACGIVDGARADCLGCMFATPGMWTVTINEL